MKKINKRETPIFFEEYKRKNKSVHYDDLDKSDEGKLVRSRLKEHLISEQHGICCYCCKTIDKDKSHNEHIKPRSSYSRYSMDYNNIVVSCSPQGNVVTCGANKGNKYDESKFVSPLDEDCEEHFRFNTDGTIEGITEKGKYTVELLNLDCYRLKESRATLYKECCLLAKNCGKKQVYDCYIKENDGKYPRHIDMVEYFYNHGYFDEDIVCIE